MIRNLIIRNPNSVFSRLQSLDLNRLSSLLWIMMIKLKAGRYQKS